MSPHPTITHPMLLPRGASRAALWSHIIGFKPQVSFYLAYVGSLQTYTVPQFPGCDMGGNNSTNPSGLLRDVSESVYRNPSVVLSVEEELRVTP